MRTKEQMNRLQFAKEDKICLGCSERKAMTEEARRERETLYAEYQKWLSEQHEKDIEPT